MTLNDLLNRFVNYRLRALIKKEFDQIRRDRRLQISLVLPPVLQLRCSALRSAPMSPMSASPSSTTAARRRVASWFRI